MRPVDGGAAYYGKFADPLPSDPSFFPIGVWFESVLSAGDVQKDKTAGLNVYVQLTQDSNLSLIRAAGMYAFPGATGGNGTETAGWMLNDEVDMRSGPGSGYTVMANSAARFPQDNRLRYANYGKGITFWETAAQAAPFVNNYEDVVSDDNYWFTDDNICGSSEGGRFFPLSALVGGRLPDALCHRAANYGLTIDKVRSLESPAASKPVWAFVEVGHPSSQPEAPTITPDEISAAVWSSIIHGARGIIYFNHSFAGPCQTQHALRETCYAPERAAVTKVDAEIAALAPVLNAPFADGVVTASAGVDQSTKWYDGHFYVLAGSTSAAAQTAAFHVPCTGNATVTVLDENRTIPLTNGQFTDAFAGPNTDHVYRIDGGSSCGAH